MKRNKQEIISQQSPSSTSPSFTPTQASLKKKKHDSSRKLEQDTSPFTPKASGIFRSPSLPEGVDGLSSSKKSKDDSFLTALLRGDGIGQGSSKSQNGSYHWLFDTPSDFRESPLIKRSKGVSRRSLDKLLDPEPALDWIEAMATPPSDDVEKEINVSSIYDEDDVVLSPAVIPESRGNRDLEKNIQPKKNVARVLFGLQTESKLDEDKNKDDDENWEENQFVTIEFNDEGKACQENVADKSSFNDEEFCNLSPTVVETISKSTPFEMKSMISASMPFKTLMVEPLARREMKQALTIKNQSCSSEKSFPSNVANDVSIDNIEMDTSVSALSPPVVSWKDLQKRESKAICNSNNVNTELKRDTNCTFEKPFTAVSRTKSNDQFKTDDNMTKKGKWKEFTDDEIDKFEGVASSAEKGDETKMEIDTDDNIELPQSHGNVNIDHSPGSATVDRHGIRSIERNQHVREVFETLHSSQRIVPLSVHSSASLAPLKGIDGSSLDTSDFMQLSPTVVSSKGNCEKEASTLNEDNLNIIESTPKRRRLDPVGRSRGNGTLMPVVNLAATLHMKESSLLVYKESLSTKEMSPPKPNGNTRRQSPHLTNAAEPKIRNAENPDPKKWKDKFENTDEKISSKSQLKHSSNGKEAYEAIINGILSEILERVLEHTQSNEQGKSMIVPLTETLSPSNCIPKTPANRKVKEFRRLRSRISVSGAKSVRKKGKNFDKMLPGTEVYSEIAEKKLEKISFLEQNFSCDDKFGTHIESQEKLPDQITEESIFKTGTGNCDNCLAEPTGNELLFSDENAKNERVRKQRNENIQKGKPREVLFPVGKEIDVPKTHEIGENEYAAQRGIKDDCFKVQNSENIIVGEVVSQVPCQVLEHRINAEGILQNGIPVAKTDVSYSCSSKSGLGHSGEYANQTQMYPPIPDRSSETSERLQWKEELVKGENTRKEARDLKFCDKGFSARVCSSSDSSTGDILDDLMFGNKKVENEYLENTQRQLRVSENVRAREYVGKPKTRDVNLNGKLSCNISQENITSCGTQKEVTGSGMPVSIIAKCPLKSTRLTSVERDKLESDVDGQGNEEEIKGKVGNCPSVIATIPCFQGFTTGSSKPVKISEDSFKKARMLLMDPDEKLLMTEREKVSTSHEGRSKAKIAIIGSSPKATEDSKLLKQAKQSRQPLLKTYVEELSGNSKSLLEVGFEEETMIVERNRQSRYIECNSSMPDSILLAKNDNNFGADACGYKNQLQIDRARAENEVEGLYNLVNSSFDIEDFTQLCDVNDVGERNAQCAISKVERKSTHRTVIEASKCLPSVDNQRLMLEPNCSGGNLTDKSGCNIVGARAQNLLPEDVNDAGDVILPEDYQPFVDLPLNTRRNRIGGSRQKVRYRALNVPFSDPSSSEPSRLGTLFASAGFNTASEKKLEKALEAARQKLESDATKYGSVGEKECKFGGFSTASGRKVNVSEKALEAARQKLESDNTKDGSVAKKECKFDGFSTASGRKVNVSESALEAARQKLESDNAKDGSVAKKECKFEGFSTASGRKVNVSESALEAARQKLESDNAKDGSVAKKECKFDGFSTASGRKVNVSESALEAARQKLESDHTKDGSVAKKECKFDGFSTASGRKVNVSESALEAARQKLESDNAKDGSVAKKECKFDGFSTVSGRKVNVSEKALEAARQKLESDNAKDGSVAKKECKFDGFSTASGRKVNVSESALEAARQKLESDNTKDGSVAKKECKFDGFSTASGRKVNVSESALEAARQKLESDNAKDGSVAKKECKFDGFSTASGRKVNVSESALEAARQKLESDNTKDGSVAKKECKFDGFSTASGRKVNVSESALEAARQKLESDNAKDGSVAKKECKFDGFSTASGRKVNVSEKALEAARQKLESDNAKDGSVAKKECKFRGFSTASGRKVNVSESALEAARQKLESDNAKDGSVAKKECKFDGFSTASGRKVNVSESALEAARQKLESDNTKDGSVAKKECKFGGFSTASGRKVNVSESALEAARQKLESDNAKDGSVAKKECKFDGFSTASGRKVSVSERTLEAARQKLESDDTKDDSAGAAKKKLESVGNKLGKSGSKDQLESIDVQLLNGKRLDDQKSTLALPNLSSYNDVNESGIRPFADKLPKHIRKDCIDDDISMIEMSERFDDDIDKAIEENPYLLCGGRVQRNVFNPSASEKSNGFGEWRKRDVVGSEDKGCAFDDQEMPLLSKRRKNLGMNRKKSFNFKSKSTNPDEFHNDRDAKYTIPLVSKISKFEDNNKTPNVARSGLVRPSSTPGLLYVSKSTKNPLAHTNRPPSAVSKSFSTPFKSSNENQRDRKASVVLKNERLKRPLFACVPFGKRRRLDEEIKSCNLAKDNVTRPQPGRLYQLKKSHQTQKLSQLTNGQSPLLLSRKQLQEHGVENCVIEVSSENSLEFTFAPFNFSQQALSSGRVFVGDGATLHLSKEGCAGLKEFYRAFLSLSGVDGSLIDQSWFNNQYRWIVWKLACMERSFPVIFAGRCLTPNDVMYQLKYRYDKEIDNSERSSIKKILERDDISTSRMVLCVSKIHHIASCPGSKEQEVKQIDNTKSMIEMTDGWYPVRAILDKPLSSLLHSGKINIGTKLCIYGANLIGNEQAVPPLEAPDSLMLELFANSTRRAHWDAKLGFQKDRRAFTVPLCSLFPDGGMVGCVDIIVARVYPVQWMEKSDSGCIFRSAVQEQKAARKYNDEKQMRMETIYQKIQKEFENSNNFRDKRKSRRKSSNPSVKELSDMKDGHQLWEILDSACDPGSLELLFSDTQKESLAQFRRKRDDEQRSLMQRKFDSAWKDVQENFPERVVVSLQKFKIVDLKVPHGKPASESYLTVWKPTEDIRSSWKEGTRMKIYNLSASLSRYKHSSSAIQLATMNSTRYEVLAIDADIANVYQPRKVSSLRTLKEDHFQSIGEVDVVGYVIHIEDHGNNNELQTVFLDDLSDVFLAIKFWGGLKNLKPYIYNMLIQSSKGIGIIHLEETVKSGCLVCFKNLVFKRNTFSTFALTAVFNDMSAAYCNPKESYLLEAICKLRSKIVDLAGYMAERRGNVQDKLRSGSRAVRMSNTPLNVTSRDAMRFPTSAFDHSNTTTPGYASPNDVMPRSRLVKFSATTAYSDTAKSPMSRIVEDQSTSEQTAGEEMETPKRSSQKRLNQVKHNALSRYGEPRSLSPLAAAITPSTRREFKPPSIKKR